MYFYYPNNQNHHSQKDHCSKQLNFLIIILNSIKNIIKLKFNPWNQTENYLWPETESHYFESYHVIYCQMIKYSVFGVILCWNGIFIATASHPQVFSSGRHAFFEVVFCRIRCVWFMHNRPKSFFNVFILVLLA